MREDLIERLRLVSARTNDPLLTEAAAALEAAREDAERYRWLVDSGKFCPAFGSGGWGIRAGGFGRSSKTDLDAAIDQARGKGGPEAGLGGGE